MSSTQNEHGQIPHAIVTAFTVVILTAGAGGIVVHVETAHPHASGPVASAFYASGAARLSESPDDGPGGFGGPAVSPLTPYVVTGGTIGAGHHVGPVLGGL
jgi:hypothetical protein